jgi:hypothetical protein
MIAAAIAPTGPIWISLRFSMAKFSCYRQLQPALRLTVATAILVMGCPLVGATSEVRRTRALFSGMLHEMIPNAHPSQTPMRPAENSQSRKAGLSVLGRG